MVQRSLEDKLALLRQHDDGVPWARVRGGRVALGRDITITQRVLALGLRADLSYVELNGAPPTWYFTHTRRSERRESVHQVVRALLQSGQQTVL